MTIPLEASATSERLLAFKIGAVGSKDGFDVSGREVVSCSSSESESGNSFSHCSNMSRNSCSVLKRRMPWPRSLILGLRIHHPRSTGSLLLFREKLSCSSYASNIASSRNSA